MIKNKNMFLLLIALATVSSAAAFFGFEGPSVGARFKHGPVSFEVRYHISLKTMLALATGVAGCVGAVRHWYAWYPNSLEKWKKRFSWANKKYGAHPLANMQLDSSNEHNFTKRRYFGPCNHLIAMVGELENALEEVDYLLYYAQKLSSGDRAHIVHEVASLQTYQHNLKYNILYIQAKQEYFMQKTASIAKNG